jgi:1-acyl-sn-glycerol-3-phosphate acyltransferase
MRSILVFLLLLAVRASARLFFRLREDWMPTKPHEMADDTRIVAILNHTSLYEPLIAGYASTKLLWRFARHGVLPVAEKTMKRPVGIFFRFLVRHTVTVTRQRDATWEEVLSKIDNRALVIILPEGRMKRRTGFDSKGREMTVRAGIADILEALPDGRILMVYSGGLHHIQAPGELLARPFRPIFCRFEMIDIANFKRELAAKYPDVAFRMAVVRDLTERRDTYCPTELQPPPIPADD